MNIAAGSMLSLAYRVLGIASFTVMTMVMTRVMTKGDFGTFTALIVVAGAAGSIAGSYASSAGYFVSNRKRDAADVANNTLLMSLVGGVFFAAVAGVVLLFYDGEHRDVVFLLGAALFPTIARAALGGVYLGTGALWKYSFSVHGFGIVGVVLTVVWMAGLGRDTVGDALGVWVVSQYLSVVALVASNLGWWGWFANHRPDGALMRDVVKFGAFTGLAGFVSYFNYRVDHLLVIWLDGSEGAGSYATAVRVAEGLWLFSTTIAIASYAAVGTLGRRESADVTAEGVRHTLLVVTAMAVPIAVLAPWLLRYLFGADYEEAAWALRILCIGTLLYAPQAVISNFYTVQMGKPWISLLLAGGSCLISIAISLVLIPRVGFVGGAWATAVSYAITAVISTALFMRVADVRFRDLWRIRREDVMSYVRLGKRIVRRGNGSPPEAEQQA